MASSSLGIRTGRGAVGRFSVHGSARMASARALRALRLIRKVSASTASVEGTLVTNSDHATDAPREASSSAHSLPTAHHKSRYERMSSDSRWDGVHSIRTGSGPRARTARPILNQRSALVQLNDGERCRPLFQPSWRGL
eukprot:7046458-Pyramimonas_sp.AAC.1